MSRPQREGGRGLPAAAASAVLVVALAVESHGADQVQGTLELVVGLRSIGRLGRITTFGGGRLRAARPRLEEVDKRDAALMSVGTLASGVLAYVFNVVAARSLGPEVYGGVGALWAGMFLLAVLLFRPIEQTVSRAIADQNARGADARAAVRSTARLAALIAALSVAACLAFWAPLTDGFALNEVNPLTDHRTQTSIVAANLVFQLAVAVAQRDD